MLTILNYGCGNLASIKKVYDKFRIPALITDNIETLNNASHIILPGVGHFSEGMKKLAPYIELLNEKVLQQKTPLLGICLGMQLLAKHSEEGNTDGLGWVDYQVQHFQHDGENEHLNIPHVGWNRAKLTQADSPLLNNIPDHSKFYFTHSYHLTGDNNTHTIGETLYGDLFPSIIQSNNVFGVQFHPEKSHQAGMQLLKNFAEIPC